MKAMYISKRSDANIPATAHREIVEDIVGSENFIRIDLRPDVEPRVERNYIAYGKYPSKLNRIKRWLEGNTMYMSNAIAKDIVGLIKERGIDVVFIDESKLGMLVRHIKKASPNTRVICFYHDIGADLFVQWAKSGGLLSKIENHFNLRGERLSNRWSDEIAVFHECDRKRFFEAYGWGPGWVIPAPSLDYGIPGREMHGASDGNAPLRVMFVGSAGLFNVRGVSWFCESVMPLVSGEVQFEIVGRVNSALRLTNPDPRIRQVGIVDSVEEYYRNADVVVTPIFEGGGMKVKTGEALAYGKCLIGTDESLHGYWERMGSDIRNRVVYRLEDPEDWAEAISELALNRPKKFNEDLYRFVRDNYFIDALEQDFRRLIAIESED